MHSIMYLMYLIIIMVIIMYVYNYLIPNGELLGVMKPVGCPTLNPPGSPKRSFRRQLFLSALPPDP